MEKELLMESFLGQTRLALLEDGDLCELYIERAGQEKLVGNIYMGRVVNVLPGMQAAFVDIGAEKNGFLYAGDIQLDIRSLGPDGQALNEQLKEMSIKKLIRAGQQVLVQVVKEPGGSKGPRLSGNITLPGRLVVLLPTVGYVGVSRRIESEQERLRLRTLSEALRPEGMGLIVRTAAEGADEETLKTDIAYLTRLWEAIHLTGDHSTAPALLHCDLSLINRSVRDMLLPDVKRLLVDGKDAHEVARKNAAMLRKSLAEKVELYTGDLPLFDLKRVNTQMERGLSRRVWLDSGGYLVIDYAEALTVIDVNTGKFVGKHSLSDTVFKINCEAVVEIVRQLRLRDIGGIIVIDFIDMDEIAQRETLLQLLKKELKRDRTKTNLVGLTGLGLVEMTRKKVHQPMHRILKMTCPMCQGSGMVLTDETVARMALDKLNALATQEGAWMIDAHPAVAGQLMLIGAPAGVRAFVHPNPACERSQFDVQGVLMNNLPPKTRPLPPQTR
ncbi:MAG: Rne/Rng family ribonuclease [Clostridia bacterium]